jgi:hypothetical protein
MCEAAPGTIWQPKGRRGPSDQQADGDVDTAAPRRRQLDGSAAGCGRPVRALTGCLVQAPAVVVGATQSGVCCLSTISDARWVLCGHPLGRDGQDRVGGHDRVDLVGPAEPCGPRPPPPSRSRLGSRRRRFVAGVPLIYDNLTE